MWSRTHLAVDSQLCKRENEREMDGVREREREGGITGRREREGKRAKETERVMYMYDEDCHTYASTYLLLQFGSHLL